MQDWERKLKLHNLQQLVGVETGFDKAIEDVLVKARSGVYKPNKENIRQGRAGTRYGNMIQGGATQDLEEDTKKSDEYKKWLKDNTNEFFINSNGTVFVAVKGEADSIDSNKARLFGSLKQAVDVLKKEKKELEKKKFVDPAGHAVKIEKQNVNMPKPMRDIMNKSFETIYDAFETGLLSKDVFEKGKKGQIGETRTWHGVQMKKVSSTGNSAKDWQPIKRGEKLASGEEPAGGQDQSQYDENELREHAKNASEAALSAAIKNSPDPTVRQTAHAEMTRRKKEEASGGAGSEFPSAEFQNKTQTGKESEKKTAFSPAGKKTSVYVPSRKEESEKEKDYTANLSQDAQTAIVQIRELGARARKAYDNSEGEKKAEAKRALDQLTAKLKELQAELTGGKKSEDSFDKESKILQEKHNKEMTDHMDKLDDLHKKLKTAKPEERQSHIDTIDKQHEAGGELISRHKKEKTALYKKHGRDEKGEKKEDNKKQKIDFESDEPIVSQIYKEDNPHSFFHKDHPDFRRMSDKELHFAYKDIQAHRAPGTAEQNRDNRARAEEELERRKNKKDSNIKKSIQGIRYF